MSMKIIGPNRHHSNAPAAESNANAANPMRNTMRPLRLLVWPSSSSDVMRLINSRGYPKFSRLPKMTHNISSIRHIASNQLRLDLGKSSPRRA